MAGAVVTLFPAQLREVLAGPQGAVMRDLSVRALRVQTAAQRLCPVKTGRLRSSIRWTLATDGRGAFARVGSDVSYAAAVHDGTAPHEIRPRNATVLRFPSTQAAGGFAFATVVHHPGTRAHPFLRDALPAALI